MDFLSIYFSYFGFFLILPIKQNVYFKSIFSLSFSTFAYYFTNSEQLYNELSFSNILAFDSSSFKDNEFTFLIFLLLSFFIGILKGLPIYIAFYLVQKLLNILDQYCIGHEMQFHSSINGSQNSLMSHFYDQTLLPFLVIKGVLLNNLVLLLLNNPIFKFNLNSIFKFYLILFSQAIPVLLMTLSLEIPFLILNRTIKHIFNAELYMVKMFFIIIVIYQTFI